MAGQEIYLGKMIESLQTDIATVVSTLNQHTIELGNINTVVAQGISSVNVGKGNQKIVSLNNASIMNQAPSANVKLFDMKALCNGIFTFKGQLKVSRLSGVSGYDYRNSYIQVSRDNGTTWTTIFTGSAQATSPFHTTHDFELDIDANFGDVIKFRLTNNSWGNDTTSCYSEVLANSMKLEYNLLDILNDGAMSIF